MWAPGIRAFIDIQEGRSNKVKRLTKRILKIKDSKISILKRAMKTFIFMYRSLMSNLSGVLKDAEIYSQNIIEAI